jgi:hypothetical protein
MRAAQAACARWPDIAVAIVDVVMETDRWGPPR